MTAHEVRFSDTAIQTLRYVAATVAAVVAGIHLLHPTLGAPRLLIHLQAGTLFDPRPLVFTLSGFLIVFGILLVYNGLYVRAVYLGGIALVVGYLIGYVAWHTVLGHGAFWPHIHGHAHHDMGVLETVWTHLIDDPTAAISKLLELVLLVLLAILYLEETPDRSDG